MSTVLAWRTPAAVNALLERHSGAVLQGFALHLAEYSVLEALLLTGGVHRDMRTLADSAALSQSTVSRLLGRLDRDGLLVRHLRETDRRSIYLELTDRGRRLLGEVKPVHDSALGCALAEALADPGLSDIAATVARDLAER